MTLTGKNIIGEQLSSDGDKTFFGVNPATGETMDPAFYEATTQEIDQAIKKASQAFQLYRQKSGLEKAHLLDTIAEEILQLGDELIHRCMLETGLPEGRLLGERTRTVNQLKMFAELLREGSWVDARIDRAIPDRKPLPKADIRSMLKPIGPVGIFGASNFPFAFSVAGGDTASALASGCTVVVKGHPAHPGTSELVAGAIQKAIKQCDFPDGTFSMVQGPSVDVGQQMVRHPLIKAIGFTGSFRGGKALYDEATRRPEPIPVYAEMGSSNPVFILPHAMKERGQEIAKGLSASVTLGVGQFCTNPGMVFQLQSGHSQNFKDHLAQHMNESASGVMLTSGIKESYQTGISRLEEKNGVEVISAYQNTQQTGHGIPHLLHTRVGAFLQDPGLQEEVFGPSTLLLTADRSEELMAAAESLHGHLTITIHGTDEDLLENKTLMSILEQKAGRLIINGYPTGVEVCHSMVHGGPYPATTDSRTTSVGTAAILRFARPVCYQDFPEVLLPEELKSSNPLKIWRLVDGNLQNE